MNERLKYYINKYKVEFIRILSALIVLLICIICEHTLQNVSPYVWLGILLVAYFVIGYDVLWQAVKNIVKGNVFNEYFLMGIATIGAFAIGEYAEAVAVMLFYQVGELFQKIAVDKSRKSINSLMDIRPDYCNLITSDGVEVADPFDVQIGDKILIKAGEKVPVDCRIIEGSSSVDSSALSGESLPIDVSPNSELLSGMVNLSGVLTAEVTAVFAESTASKIIDLIENASSNKAKSENFISKFAKYYTPIVVLVALCLAVIPPLIDGGWEVWIYRALTFLVVSCPCALVISVPLSFFAGIGKAGRLGVLVKGGNYMEALAKAKIVVFDKTGTLTKGQFEVVSIISDNKEELLKLVAHAEHFSSHIIAKAIVKKYNGIIDESIISDQRELAGYGISAIIDGHNVLVGNEKLMKENNVVYPDITDIGTKLYVAIEGVYAGTIVVADVVKEDSYKAISELKNLGVEKVIMLTGDNKAVANSIAKELDLDNVYSELTPIDKVNYLDKIMDENQGKKVVFVGDGINDAPVLSKADIGMAMGGVGADSAIEASDIVLMTDEPSKIAKGIQLSRKTLKIVRENIIFSILIKVLVLCFSAFGFVNMWWAVFADVGVSFLAILNAIRLLK